jgi:hypothetical protein
MALTVDVTGLALRMVRELATANGFVLEDDSSLPRAFEGLATAVQRKRGARDSTFTCFKLGVLCFYFFPDLWRRVWARVATEGEVIYPLDQYVFSPKTTFRSNAILKFHHHLAHIAPITIAAMTGAMEAPVFANLATFATAGIREATRRLHVVSLTPPHPTPLIEVCVLSEAWAVGLFAYLLTPPVQGRACHGQPSVHRVSPREVWLSQTNLCFEIDANIWSESFLRGVITPSSAPVSRDTLLEAGRTAARMALTNLGMPADLLAAMVAEGVPTFGPLMLGEGEVLSFPAARTLLRMNKPSRGFDGLQWFAFATSDTRYPTTTAVPASWFRDTWSTGATSYLWPFDIPDEVQTISSGTATGVRDAWDAVHRPRFPAPFDAEDPAVQRVIVPSWSAPEPPAAAPPPADGLAPMSQVSAVVEVVEEEDTDLPAPAPLPARITERTERTDRTEAPTAVAASALVGLAHLDDAAVATEPALTLQRLNSLSSVEGSVSAPLVTATVNHQLAIEPDDSPIGLGLGLALPPPPTAPPLQDSDLLILACRGLPTAELRAFRDSTTAVVREMGVGSLSEPGVSLRAAANTVHPSAGKLPAFPTTALSDARGAAVGSVTLEPDGERYRITLQTSKTVNLLDLLAAIDMTLRARR